MLTPFQTVGPFLSLGLKAGVDARPDADISQLVVVRGRLIDGAGAGIPDGVLEWWHPSATMIQRTLTSEDGSFVLETVTPAVSGTEAGEPVPYFAVRILGRGILTQYLTRMYFADQLRDATDAVLRLVPADRRHTLIASQIGSNQYHFDVVVQGHDETVFFDF